MAWSSAIDGYMYSVASGERAMSEGARSIAYANSHNKGVEEYFSVKVNPLYKGEPRPLSSRFARSRTGDIFTKSERDVITNTTRRRPAEWLAIPTQGERTQKRYHL